MSQMKICPNGHRYDASLPECPYCPKSGSAARTMVDDGGTAGGTAATLIDNSGGGMGVDLNKTLIDDGNMGQPASRGAAPRRNPRATMIMTSEDHEDASSEVAENRKLVGWLACYTWNSFGDSYVLREGKTQVGAEDVCAIHIDDSMISGQHAQFLFRGSKLRLRDNFSTTGTFVNGVDIEDEPRVLEDGDEIKMGSTIFKLRLV